MDRKTWINTLCVISVLASNPLISQSPSREEQIVRSTYGALSLLCSLEPVTASLGQAATDQQISEATPTFEISNVKVGDLASITGRPWNTRYSVPDAGEKVLVGHDELDSFSGPKSTGGSDANWRVVRVHWEVDPSWSAKRIDAIKASTMTVGDVLKVASWNWTGYPSTYTRYATFSVLITYQGITLGPYTASFFFGKDNATGKKVVVPQDAFVSGQLLWEALLPTAYPGALIRDPDLHKQYPTLDHWIDEHQSESSTCSSPRPDLCCSSEGVCSLPRAAVDKDLAVASKGQ